MNEYINTLIEKNARNEEIFQLRTADEKEWTFKKLSIKFGLTVPRVHQIFQYMQRKREVKEV